MALKLYHCWASRSLRPLWTLEELGMEYELQVMDFPPRVLHPEFLEVNPAGTVPFLIDGDIQMNESVAMCQYLADCYGPSSLVVQPHEHDYADYLNWMYRSDATLTFPQTIVLRYSQFEPDPNLAKAVEDYTKWFFSRLRTLEAALQGKQYLCEERFTLADICVFFALYLADVRLDLSAGFKPNTLDYYQRLKMRPTFQKIEAIKR